MSTLRVGIAGYGIVGRRRHACVDRNARLSLVAVCDRAFDAECVDPNGIRRYRDYRRLLTEDLDVLIVCLTNDIAPEVTIAGLERGLHVFCEKPPGRTLDDIIKVVRCQRQHPRLKLMYGFNHRYHESVQDALSVIRSDRLGPIINMRAVYGKSQLVTFNQSDWRTKRDVAGGGVLLDQGIHMVDLMRLFAGEFTTVYSFVSNSHWGYDVEDNAYALMRTEKGVVGLLHSSATQWRHRFHLDINLERGSLILGGILSGSKSYGAETLTIVEADPNNDAGDPREQQIRYNNDPSWDEEIAQFCKCIDEDKKLESASAEDALETMRLVHQIYYSDPLWQEKYAIKNPSLVNI